jgi:hypothetical protein
LNKPVAGWKSSEFWSNLLSQVTPVVGLLVTLGVVTQVQGDAWSKTGVAIIGAIASIVAAFAGSSTAKNYTNNRTKLKSGE